ncbi:MAG TPA: TolC family protein [Terriglobales bacterium]|nr:TolC family protein [Terriglobales bacterium]
MRRTDFLLVIAMFCHSAFCDAWAQSPAPPQIPASAPGQVPAPAPAQAPTPPPAQVPPPPGQIPAPQRLTLHDAEALALKNNPQITVARLNALASEQVVRQTRAGLLPTAVVNLTGVDAEENSRIAAGALNNPVLFSRAASGAFLSQLITDFGRSTNLLSSSKLRAKAEDQNALATAQQIGLAVDQAFYQVLQTAALVKVAAQTVSERQTVVDRVQALTQAKLKSDLDLSFAQVDLAQSKLLLLEAQNNYNSAQAALSAILGFPSLQNFELVEEDTGFPAPPPDVNSLIAEALQKRPDVAALAYGYQASQKFWDAERDLMRPTVSALATIGSVPFDTGNVPSWWGGAGVNVSIPVFNGFLFNARAHEAELASQADNQRLLDLRNRVARDVRTAWLDLNRTYSQLDVTRQLQQQAGLALDLAQTRYDLGLGSIVEFSQAELQKTQADISNTNARYQYRYAQARLRYELGEH